ncbi:CsbD family protein [Hyphomicrobium sp. NDB2Meth4]|uniref:CsbD family protein n=1 Tax=Hyphomicrobium sp. NDB2Meth4 TaxID=1892846 RepID=UPI000931347B|nr:CsbD family protein [Hyphomicrobium sp. NDB2Meth4]
MGSATDKIKGYANQVAGNIKSGIGKATGSEELEVKGSVQNLKGKAQVAVGDVKETVKDGANKAADEINRNL